MPITPGWDLIRISQELEDYDMVNMIAAGIAKNGYTGEGIRSFVANLKDFKSIGGGLVSMDPDGQSIVSVEL